MSTALTTNDQKMTTLAQFINARKENLRAVATQSIDVERVTKIVLAAAAKTPALLECTPASVYSAVQQAVQLGLEPGSPLQHAALVPYGKTCTLIVMYRGLVALARRSGEIATIEARAVYENDKFRVSFGTDPRIEHEPSLKSPGTLVAVYAVATMRSGEKQFDAMSKADVDAIRARSKAGGSGPWVTDYAEMAKKTIVRRLSKMLPLTIEAAEVLNAEDDADRGAQTLTAVPDVVEDAPTLPEASVSVRAETEKTAVKETK